MNSPDDLPQLLRSWQHAPRPAVNFGADVWDRIGQGQKAGDPGFVVRWALPFAAGIALLFGVGFGWRDARQVHAERMAVAYVKTIDPLQMTAPRHHHAP